MQEAFGWNPLWVGCVIAAVSLFIVFGGIQRIAQVSAVLVPVMAISYVVLALVIIVMNIGLIPKETEESYSEVINAYLVHPSL